MSVNCFITTHKDRTPERDYFFGLTQFALTMSGYSPTIVEKPMLERYFACEYLANEYIYIICDDDIIPGTPDTLKKLVEIMRKHPEYSQLGLSWKPNMTDESNSSWIRHKSEDIWEMDHVGGCMAIRKGTIKNFGYKTEFESGYGDDRVMGRVARDQGLKVGIVPNLFFHHLGINSTFKS